MSQAVITHNLATHIFWDMKAEAQREQAEYDEMVRECAEQGFRPKYCIHGTYMWTDWDPICGYCENGEPLWSDSRDWARAKDEAERILEAVAQRRMVVLEVVRLDPRNSELREKLVDWSLEPFGKYGK